MASKDYKEIKKADLLALAGRKKAAVKASMTKDQELKAIKKADKAKSDATAKKKPASKKVKTAAKKTIAKKSVAKPAAKAKKAAKAKSGSAFKLNGGEKFYSARENGEYPVNETISLPEGYGDNKIVAMVQGPARLYLYWETLKESVEAARETLDKGWSKVRWALRIYDVTGIDFDGSNANIRFDVDINPEAGKYYLDVVRDDTEYIVALGLLDNDERFATICFSERVRTPSVGVSGQADGEWQVTDEDFEKLAQYSGGHLAGSVYGEDISSESVSSISCISSEMGGEVTPRIKDFYLWANCELVIYGGTGPDANVTLQGHRVSLRPDGTFTARFALPDGSQDLPIKAKSAYGMEKEIFITVSKSSNILK